MLTKPRNVEVRRNASGRRKIYWRLRDGTRIRLSDDPETAFAEAEERNRELDRERAGLAPANAREGTVSQLIQRYEADPDFLERAPKTRAGYRQCLGWLDVSFGDLPTGAITPQLVQKIKRNGADTPWLTNARLRVIRLLWAWGKRHGIVEANPASAFRQLTTRPRDVVWQPEEVAAMIKHACPSISLAVLLALYTCQREGDLIALRWGDFNNGRLEFRQRKTGRLVAHSCHPILRATLERAPRRALTILASEVTGASYREDHFRHVFSYERARVGLRPGLQFRDLRRTGAVTLARQGVPLTHIAALGGWSIARTATILQTYIPLDEAMASSAAAAMTVPTVAAGAEVIRLADRKLAAPAGWAEP